MDLDEIERRTIDHYQQSASAFWEGTRDHDVSQNRMALLRHMDGEGPFRILDFGCGPGRDLIAFKKLGHEPIGLDATVEFCDMARRHSGCDVWQQRFLSLKLTPHFFDGVFANASLFHVPGNALKQVLAQLCDSLKPSGILFTSNPRGNDEEGWNGSRYGAWHSESVWLAHLEAVGFEILETYYRPAGKPRHLQPWFATVGRKRE